MYTYIYIYVHIYIYIYNLGPGDRARHPSPPEVGFNKCTVSKLHGKNTALCVVRKLLPLISPSYIGTLGWLSRAFRPLSVSRFAALSFCRFGTTLVFVCVLFPFCRFSQRGVSRIPFSVSGAILNYYSAHCYCHYYYYCYY